MEGRLNDRTRGLRQLPLYLLCYLIWLGFGVVSVWTVLQFREALLLLLPIIGPWAMGAVDKFGLVILGLAAIVWIFYIEDHLRSGVQRGTFPRRAVRVALIQAVALGIAYGLQLLMLLILSRRV